MKLLLKMTILALLSSCGAADQYEEDQKQQEHEKQIADLERQLEEKELEDKLAAPPPSEEEEESEATTANGTNNINNNSVVVNIDVGSDYFWKDPSTPLLRVGMSKQQVVDLFGTPKEIRDNEWLYDDICVKDYHYCSIGFSADVVDYQRNVNGRHINWEDRW